MKKNYKLIIGIIIIITTVTIISDWENFKAGLFGKTPIEKVQKYNRLNLN